MDSLLARWLIQLRLDDGRLPRSQSPEVRERSGDGESWCDGCGLILSKSERVVRATVLDDPRRFRLHRECFLIWQEQRIQTYESRR